ncbi:MAG: DNA-binding protein [Thaumarchaeota archaeon]|nr:DNA-binding protein [Nitrososphaerota archaeon]|tara:strand:- start:494 stop:775 length:282 start_codon:yes stop_codon:yes gene_type:complete
MAESNENIDQQANSQQKQEAIREQMLKVLLTTEARERLANIKMVKPDVAKMIEDQIIQLASSGKINKSITDEEIKSFLSSVQKPQKDFKIRWA